MVDSMLELIPYAAVHHIGMYRTQQLPVQYYNRLPKKCESDVAIVLDPVLATGGTILSVVGILSKWGVKKIHVICVLASKSGIDTLTKKFPQIKLTVGHVDPKVNEEGKLIPGMGDVGDRLFNAPSIDDEESLLHASKKRKLPN